VGSLLAHSKSIRKEQSVASILGSLLRQIVGGMERVPEGILRAFEKQKKVIGGREPRLLDIVRMLQTITSSLPTFVLEYVLTFNLHTRPKRQIKLFNLTLWTSVQDGVRTTKDSLVLGQGGRPSTTDTQKCATRQTSVLPGVAVGLPSMAAGRGRQPSGWATGSIV